MFAHELMRNALIGGGAVALACGLLGWLLVLRAQVFAADALGHVAFVGAVAAAAAGFSERLGVFALAVIVAAGMGVLDRRARPGDVAIGVTFTAVLGLGTLFVAILAAGSGAGLTTANALFGSILSLGAGAARAAALLSIAVCGAAVAIARPLVFATLDPDVALVQGVPVRALGMLFLLLLALTTAEGTQAVGALQVLGLLAAPAGAAHALTGRLWPGIAISVVVALTSVWGGLALSYAIDGVPPSSAIIGVAALAYAAARLARR